MPFLQNMSLLLLPATSMLPGLGHSSPATSNPPFCGLQPKAIKSSQPLEGESFIGTPASVNRLRPKVEFEPRSFDVHLDGANTNSIDYPGPLGHNMSITSVGIHYGTFYWDTNGTMYAGYIGPCNGSDTNIAQAVAIVNPSTLGVDDVWQPPAKYANTTLNFSYMQLLVDTATIVVNAAQGQIFILQKCQDACGKPTIEFRRLIDLTSSGVLKGNTLLNSMMDSTGNVWFTTGAVDGVGAAEPTNSTIIGYIEQDDTIHSLEVPNQTVENGICLSDTNIFVNTGPSGKDNHANAEGFMAAFGPGPVTSVHILWNSTYPAGSNKKLGAFAPGSGTTPTLLGHDILATADNADIQINLLIYRQNDTGSDVKLICKLPLFHPNASWDGNASWDDNAAIMHFDGKNYGVVMQNMDHESGYAEHKDINGPYNNLTSQSPGVSKFFVAGDGSGCHLEWTNPGTMTTAPILSTATGLIYGYEQLQELANDGHYVWYATAIDWDSGKTVWKARTGAGGSFNNYYRNTFLGPDGTFYQLVQDGVAIVKDG